jgi:hypothetical protein
VRPVREQFEHDRIIRLLQVRYRRKYEVAINPGAEQNASVTSGELAVYPDLVLYSPERGRRLQGTIEVETGESVNTLEAMAEWGPFSRLRVPFYLYVPPNSLDTARRLCTDHQVTVSEIWTYHTAADQVRFTMVHRAPEAQQPRPKPEPKPKETKVKEVKAKETKLPKKAPPVKKAAAKKAPPDRKAAKSAKTTKTTKTTKSAKAAKVAKKAARRR